MWRGVRAKIVISGAWQSEGEGKIMISGHKVE
jgi:hypothetical protein